MKKRYLAALLILLSIASLFIGVKDISPILRGIPWHYGIADAVQLSRTAGEDEYRLCMLPRR
ncbi:hypothetical protein EI981_27050 [Paenibacillus lutimineralis]|uniref:Uncharacterized protein n=1 Tax=Paenibacillus lutimineralis TaxID=2707005 RepID=A0A3S9V585_9BACL|nr:hypothetical protein EI981_27050 [Paenibacillus lutimineralis]